MHYMSDKLSVKPSDKSPTTGHYLLVLSRRVTLPSKFCSAETMNGISFFVSNESPSTRPARSVALTSSGKKNRSRVSL